MNKVECSLGRYSPGATKLGFGRTIKAWLFWEAHRDRMNESMNNKTLKVSFQATVYVGKGCLFYIFIFLLTIVWNVWYNIDSSYYFNTRHWIFSMLAWLFFADWDMRVILDGMCKQKVFATMATSIWMEWIDG